SVGPRLNAAGRLDDMALGIECLLAADRARAMELAIRLDRLNRERREIEAQMQESALALVGGIRPDGDYTLCVHHPEWHGGVVGDKHVKAVLALDGRRYGASRFGSAEPLGATIEAVYRLEVDDFRGEPSVQLVVEHMVSG